MKFHSFIILFYLLFPIIYFAQETSECGSDLATERLMSKNPLFGRQIQNLDRRIANRQTDFYQRDASLFVIPTVVHVIHTGEPIGSGSNISDNQIESAIAAMNEDFRKMAGSNGDGNGVDVEIEFCLASRDPDDNSTNGIMRVDGSQIENYAEQGISLSNQGADEEDVKALSRWPKADYCNIWIVNEINDNDGESGIQGFAYFPTSSLVDGITILFNAFGTEGNLKPYTNMNRTATHEAGHFLGLYHTFHLSSDCEESNCATQGDRICDTPVTVQNSSCSLPECNETQQVENYMDYTSQTCKNMFTEGQKERMIYTLTEDRSSLLNSTGCLSPTDNDASISGIVSPKGSLCSNTLLPEVMLRNYGNTTLTAVRINYTIDSGSLLQYDWTGSLPSGQTEIVTLPTLEAPFGDQVFVAYTSLPNGMDDEYMQNDERQSSFTVSSGSVSSVIIDLDFAGSETTWKIKQGDLVMAEGGPYNDNSPGYITEEVCLSEGCYEFIMEDDYGDGLGFLSGSYKLVNSDGEQVIHEQNNADNNFGFSISHDFCSGSGESTGIGEKEDFAKDVQVAIYPNPNDGMSFQLDMNNLGLGSERLRVSAYNAQGMLINSWTDNMYDPNIYSKKYRFKNNLAEGIYLILIEANGKHHLQKLIVK